jgi:hypothetical protein
MLPKVFVTSYQVVRCHISEDNSCEECANFWVCDNICNPHVVENVSELVKVYMQICIHVI